MTKEIFDGYKYIEGGVCAAKGFVANGLNCGINPVKEKFDLGVVYSETECMETRLRFFHKVFHFQYEQLRSVQKKSAYLSMIQKEK